MAEKIATARQAAMSVLEQLDDRDLVAALATTRSCRRRSPSLRRAEADLTVQGMPSDGQRGVFTSQARSRGQRDLRGTRAVTPVQRGCLGQEEAGAVLAELVGEIGSVVAWAK